MSISITVKSPFELKSTLATMKCARKKNSLMCIWDSDIKAVEDAIEIIEAIRDMQAKSHS